MCNVYYLGLTPFSSSLSSSLRVPKSARSLSRFRGFKETVRPLAQRFEKARMFSETAGQGRSDKMMIYSERSLQSTPLRVVTILGRRKLGRRRTRRGLHLRMHAQTSRSLASRSPSCSTS